MDSKGWPLGHSVFANIDGCVIGHVSERGIPGCHTLVVLPVVQEQNFFLGQDDIVNAVRHFGIPANGGIW